MASRPNTGPVVVSQVPQPTTSGTSSQRAKQARRIMALTGEWRPNTPFSTDDGLKVTLAREPGLTPDDRLLVPMRFQCPITGDFARDWTFEWAKFQTLRLGERSIPQGRPLRSFPFSTMLMNDDAAATADFVVWDGAADPQAVIRELAAVLGDDQAAGDESARPAPFRLTVSQQALWPGFLVNTRAVLTTLRATQRGGEPGVEYLDLTFDEYEPLEADRRTGNTSRRHTLRPGVDDLYEIAKRYLRSPSKWRLIANANGIKGVSPGSEAELSKWAKKHKKKTLTIPPD
jgi:hypothetical protein